MWENGTNVPGFYEGLKRRFQNPSFAAVGVAAGAGAGAWAGAADTANAQ